MTVWAGAGVQAPHYTGAMPNVCLLQTRERHCKDTGSRPTSLRGRWVPLYPGTGHERDPPAPPPVSAGRCIVSDIPLTHYTSCNYGGRHCIHCCKQSQEGWFAFSESSRQAAHVRPDGLPPICAECPCTASLVREHMQFVRHPGLAKSQQHLMLGASQFQTHLQV